MARCAPALAAATLALLSAGTARADWTVAAYLGSAYTHANTLRLNQPDAATAAVLQGVTYDSRSFDAPLYYGVRFSRAAGGHLAIEAELIHLKVYARTSDTVAVSGTVQGLPVAGPSPLSLVVQRFSISHGLNLLFGNIAWRQDGPRRVTFVARAGAGIAIPHGESTIAGTPQEQYEWSSLALQAGGGVAVKLPGAAHALLEYKLTTAAPQVSVAQGSISGRYVSHHFIFGLSLSR